LTQRDSRIGVLPVGYADGYPRAVSNSAEVLVAGKRSPVVGRVSMGYTLIGADGDDRITAEELAACADTIPYCITTGITPRVARRVSE
jgi:alanine racemase